MASSGHNRGNIAILNLLSTLALWVLSLYYVGGRQKLSLPISHGYISMQYNQVCKHV